VRVRKALLLGLVLVLAVTSLAVVACGSDEEAKAALRTALDTVDVKVSEFTASAITSTVPELKAAKDALAPDWQAVVDAAGKIEGADIPGAEKAWSDLSAAVDAIPDDAVLAEAGAALLPVAQVLLDAKDGLRELVGPTE
jgi:hypothetical protein